MKIVTELKVQRTMRNISQKALGEIIGVSQTYIGMLESQREVPSMATSRKLEAIFNVKIDKLLSSTSMAGGKY